MSRRTIAVAVATVAALAAIAAFGAIFASKPSAKQKGRVLAYRPSMPTAMVKGHIADLLLRNGREGGQGGDPDEGGDPAAEAVADRAYPFTNIDFAETKRAAAAAASVRGRSAHFGTNWQEVGPSTLNVDRLATQTSNRPTQWSGRVTAMAIAPDCGTSTCRLYVAAAGGGLWMTQDALAATPHWAPISEADVPSTSMGSVLIDPTDKNSRTIYLGTGEESGSSDSEAGVGLYKSTNGGRNWSLVPGSLAVAANRAIGAIAVDPTNASHILIGTDVARHGASSVFGGRMTPPAAPPVALYESTDGGASFHVVLQLPSDPVNPASPNGSDFFRGGVTDVQYDPTHPGTLFASVTDYGLFRSTNNGATWTQIYTGVPDPALFGIRYEFAPVTLANGNTRIYLGEGSNEDLPDDASKLWRTDDALTATPAWAEMSSPNPADPRYGSFDFCQAQCSYDMWVASPPGHPDEVWLGGSMQYGELPPYAGPDFSNGRAIVRSTDGGTHWTDMTGDERVAFEDVHPDQHAVVFASSNPGIAFFGSDGGVTRTSGTFSNASANCDSRDLSGQDLANCHQFLSAVPTRLITMNVGLRTLQFQSISASAQNPLNDLLGGTQDNGTPAFEGSQQGTWILTMSGDGGQSGIDVANRNLRYHTYFGAQGNVNFHGNNPNTWDWYMDPQLYSGELSSFYVPFIADPKVSRAAYMGAEHVWRTLDGGGPQSFLDAHCFTNGGPNGDLIFTGACGDWVSLGEPLGSNSFGTTRGGQYVVATERASSDANTMWAATRLGRVFVTKNVNATGNLVDYEDAFGAGVTLHNEADVKWTRIDDGESTHPVTPQRFPSGISIDASDPNHAIVTYSGYDAYAVAAGTPTGHVFDVHYNPATGTATWQNISYDLGDQPITDVQFDSDSGNIYVATDFGVDVLASGSTSWVPVSGGLPPVAVYGLTLMKENNNSKLLYAATHGRGIYRMRLPNEARHTR